MFSTRNSHNDKKDAPMTTTLRDYQRNALSLVSDSLEASDSRATLHMPCGSGKTHVAAAYLAQRAGHHVFFVPSIALLAQTLQRLCDDMDASWSFVAVCSDPSVATDQEGLPNPRVLTVTTDSSELADALSVPRNVVVVSTYASSGVVADSAASFDVMVLDEAHRTAGTTDRAWSVPMTDAITASRRLFMTATTKNVTVVENDDDSYDLEVFSMDSLPDYGPHIEPISWREAISQHHLSDYQVAVVGVQEESIYELIRDKALRDEIVSTESAVAQLALLRAHDLFEDLSRVLVFHNRVEDSLHWCEQFSALAYVDGRSATTNVFHVDAQSTAEARETALSTLRDSGESMTVVSNCRVLSEGVDVPALDAVMFAAPRNSANDLIQIIGRALRVNPDNPTAKATIILPLIESASSENLDSALTTRQYAFCWRLLTALAEVDEQVSQNVIAKLASDGRTEQEVSDHESATINVEVINTEGLAEHASYAFRLNVLGRMYGHHPRTVAVLREYVAERGHAFPSANEFYEGYPLGARVRSARDAYAAHRLKTKIVNMYQQVEGWSWTPKPTTRSITDQRYVELAELLREKTGISTIRRGQTMVDPVTGLTVKIGQKVNDWSWRKTLSAPLRQRVEAVVR